MSASRTRPATLGGKLSRKHVSLLPRSEAVGLVAAVVGSWRGRYCSTFLWRGETGIGHSSIVGSHATVHFPQYFAPLIDIPRQHY